MSYSVAELIEIVNQQTFSKEEQQRIKIEFSDFISSFEKECQDHSDRITMRSEDYERVYTI